MIDLDALAELEKRATPGPWFDDLHFSPREDAALIAAARNALPELIRLARIGQKVESEIVQMGLCEIPRLTLKAGTLYRFKKMHQCVSCQNYEDGK